jgi:hydroxyacylglutathione hydrolase
MSTLGFERIANPYLRAGLSREAFVGEILGHVPPFPPYYKRMKQVNSRGADPLPTLPGATTAIGARDFHNMVDSGHVVIDLRDQLSFGAGHIPGAFGIGAHGHLSAWAAWVVPYDTPILLVAPHESDINPAVRSLVRVGLDDVRGYLEGGIERWIAEGFAVTHTPQAAPAELMAELPRGRVKVIDVRSDEEWSDGHIAGAEHVMGGVIAEHALSLPRDGVTLALVCGSGYRSTVAASVLERTGFTNLLNVTGGMAAWQHAGLPVRHGE